MLRRSPFYTHFSLGFKIVLLLLVFPCVYFGGAGAAYFYRQHTFLPDQYEAKIVPLPTPDKTSRLLVFAPHCDDETLGCGGLIERTLELGGAVRTVMLTNGDGFRTAVERQTRNLRVEPQDYIRFASTRQDESIKAMQSLGIPRKDVLFFGYPDRGLMSLWNDHWSRSKLYTSSFTRCSASPYTNTYHTSSKYCGEDLLDDIKSEIQDFHPTKIMVTHPSDDHPDHAASSAFVTLALKQLQNESRPGSWLRRVRLSYYLVHRGDWPMPQGAHLNEILDPPRQMAHLDTRWSSLALKPSEVQRKARSIELYPSQTSLMGRFLMSFARRTEIYGDNAINALVSVPDNTMRVDANPKDWARITPVLLDPVRDNLIRDLQGGGDIRALFTSQDNNFLYVRIDTRQPVSSRFSYTVRLRVFSEFEETTQDVFTLHIPVSSANSMLDGQIRVAARGRIIEASIPLSSILSGINGHRIKLLALKAETALAGVEIDKTGIRFVEVPVAPTRGEGLPHLNPTPMNTKRGAYATGHHGRYVRSDT